MSSLSRCITLLRTTNNGVKMLPSLFWDERAFPGSDSRRLGWPMLSHLMKLESCSLQDASNVTSAYYSTHTFGKHTKTMTQTVQYFPLAYRGNMVYEDTVPMTKEEYKRSAEAIGRIQAKFDEKKLKEEFKQ